MAAASAHPKRINSQLMVLAWLAMAAAAAAAAVTLFFPDLLYVGRPKPSSYWIRHLRSSQPLKRQRAIEALTERGAAVVPDLVQLLDEDPPFVRGSAVQALGRIGVDTASAVQAVGRTLHDRMPYVRLEAAYALKRLGAASAPALPDLIQALTDTDPSPSIRLLAADALEQIGAPAVPSLIGAIRSGDDDLAMPAAQIMARIGRGATDQLETIEPLIHQEPETVRTSVFETLSKIGGPAVGGLIRALADEDPSIRVHAARALLDIGPGARAAIPALVERLKDPTDDTRAQVAYALAHVGVDDGAIAALVEMAENSQSDLAAHAATYALMRTGPQGGQALITLLGSTNYEARLQAAALLGDVRAQARDAVPDLRKIAQDEDDPIRLWAAISLLRLGEDPSELIPIFVAGLSHAEARGRSGAIDALKTIGTAARDAAPALKELIERESNPSIRGEAYRVLEKIDPDIAREVRPSNETGPVGNGPPVMPRSTQETANAGGEKE